MIRARNDINVYMCKIINMIGFGKVRYDLNKKMKQGIKRYCHNRSYEIRQGKNLSFRALSRKISHIKSLGSYYAEENVRLRLDAKVNIKM